MRLQVLKAAVIGTAVVLLLAGCGSSSKKSSPPATTPPRTEAPSTTSMTAAPSPYKATATPTTGLKDGDKITVTVSGFKPNLTLGINECSTKTDNTGSGCDLTGIQTIKTGADGSATGSITIKVGPFGKDKVVCTQVKAPDYCLISVGELSADPNAERSNDIKLSFAS